ncbi:MAG: cyclic nucleotide-binding domain-containing protein [Lachnospiraceae bacterium]|jgi:CRP-like cAMP-binding protein|nr:cyclic nucleotide-binding domain-containing protein [Lachnospiraceae bacterium]
MEIIKFCDKDIIASYYKIDLEKYGSWLPYDPDFCIFSPEETILEPGYIVEYLYIVLSGDAYVCAPGDDGNELLHIFCREGDIFGNAEFFMEDHCFSLVKSLNECVCMRIHTKACRKQILADCRLLSILGYSLAHMLSSTARNNACNKFMPLDNRLASRILNVEKGGIYDKNLSYEAEYLGVSYRHLLRCLKYFVDENIISRQSKGIYRIENREALVTLKKNVESGIW